MWYSASIRMKSKIITEKESESLIEDCIILIEAGSELEAQEEAEKIGRSKEHSYLNHLGETVEWLLAGVSQVQDLCTEEITSGMDVFSIMNRDESDL